MWGVLDVLVGDDIRRKGPTKGVGAEDSSV